jgi:hypothetical protein
MENPYLAVWLAVNQSSETKENSMPRLAICLLVLLLSSLSFASENEPTYCDDPAVWVDWHEKSSKQAGNLDFQTLHALWMGLCMKVKSGGLTEDEAESIFESARETLLEQRRKEKARPYVPMS